MLKFEYFLKIFQVSTFYGKTQYDKQKKELIKQRRQALKANNDKLYEEIVIKMVQEEEVLIQSKMFEIL